MEDKHWEEGLRKLLEDYAPDGIQPDWEAFASYLQIHQQMHELEESQVFDENLKESLAGFEAGKSEGWDRIESSLDLADKQFDKQIREKLHHLHPSYNPGTWILLKRRLSGAGLRAKLMAFKVVEVAAVLLFLFTAFQLGQQGKLPFETSFFQNQKFFFQDSGEKMASAEEDLSGIRSEDESVEQELSADVTSVEIATDETSGLIGVGENLEAQGSNAQDISRHATSVNPMPASAVNPVRIEKPGITSLPLHASMSDAIAANTSTIGQESGGKSIFKKLNVANFISTILSPITSMKDKSLPKLAYVKQPARTYTEFGIISQLDYNMLRMPEDRLYSAGKQIVFPQQGIPSSNLGCGFSFAIAHPRWALQSGVIYSAKNFKPGRHLMVGGTVNNSSVEFEAMRLQLVSLPLHFRYRVDNKGAFKTYGLAGVGWNIIAQSNIDVSVSYQFPTLSYGTNPNSDPNLSPIIRETRRISEHIRDGAPFSTKSFFTVEAGAGVEYSVTEHKTLFLQSALQYQVPNLPFSNNNGKHIRSVSFQAGVRSPLGN